MKREMAQIFKTVSLRKIFTSATALSFLICISNCSSKNEKADSVTAPAGMHALNLSSYGKPFSIFIPDTSSGKLMITEISTGALQVKVGDHFGISIQEQSADLALLKKDLQEDEINKLKNILKEESNGLIWESEVVRPEYHFLLNQKVNENDYSFEDIRDNQANPYSKEDVQRMYDAGKNIQAVKKQTNS